MSDPEIDRLYQLPLNEFTAARNALAKAKGPEVRSLEKPPVPAWAVNQLYWQRRPEYDALVEASEAARRTHKTVLAGRGGDVRAATRVHDQALDSALKSTLALLEEAGHPVTDATRQSIVTTLRALPSDDPPGRLARVLQPGGFEMLSGFSIAGGGRVPAAKPAARTPARENAAKEKPAKTAADAKALARAREVVTARTRELRQAEHIAKREEFDAARAAREADKVERRVAEARAAFEAAREALEEAEAEVPPAARAREAAARRAEQADEKLEAARARLEAAQAELKDA